MVDKSVDSRHDVVVVGVGGAGSATVHELAARGLDVLGLEQFDVPHARGSSHGSTRIIRLTQPEHPSYVPLVRRAYERWRALEEATGRTLVHTTGSVHAGGPGTTIVDDAREACEENGVEYEHLSAAEINERFPGYDLPEGFSGVYQADGGFLDCERCVVAHVEAAHAAGATVRAREPVLDWTETADGVEVTTNKGRYAADRIVVTAGAWAGKLVPELEGELTPTRRVMAWLQPERPERFAPEAFPVFSLRDDARDWNGYGFPVYDVPGFKFGRGPSVPAAVDPDRMSQEPTHAEEELLRKFAAQYFPDGAGPTMQLQTCMITDSTDGHFLLGRLPDRPVSVAAGFTGHGFKFSSVVGEAMADFVVDGDTDLPVDVHRLSRLEGL